jgi:feruloyl esterase
LPLLLSAQATKPDVSPAQPLNLPVVAPIVDCSALLSVDISEAVGAPTRVTSATVVNEGTTAPYCKVMGQIDARLRFEARYPLAWTQRLIFSPGLFQLPALNVDKFALTFAQDMGNRRHEDIFGENYQARIDYGYRGLHVVILASKALAAKFYNQGPKYTYYHACSEPGREGMMDVQRFPEDFNGIVAGCALLDTTANNTFYNGWNLLKNTGADGNPIITVDKLPILHKAVLDQCDAADGVKDGLISDPMACHPDLSVVECKLGQSPDSCLTAEQIHVAKEIYQGAHDAQGGKLVPSGPLPGSELSWEGPIVNSPKRKDNWEELELGTTLALRYLFYDPNPPATLKLSDLKFDRATFEATTKLHSLYDATDPDLRTFAKNGSKMILWHGLADTQVSPLNSISYFNAMQKLMGSDAVDKFARLYLFPGTYHCGGGGVMNRDLLTPLMAWVERGIAPGVVIASRIPASAPGSMANGGSTPAPDLTRPIYPYPYTTVYAGKGDINDAANFVKGPARPYTAAELNWFGAGFYAPKYEKWCTATGTTFNCKDSRDIK